MNQRGFTLLELLVCSAVLSLLTLLSLQSLPLLNDALYEREYRQLINSFAVARQQAVAHNRRSRITPVNSWSDGWTVTLEAAAAQTPQVVLHQDALRHIDIHATTLKNYVSFTGTGEARFESVKSPGGFMAGSMTICPRNKKSLPKKIILSKGGRLRTKTGTAKDCSA